ncbi:MAG: radical SAM family heme chaperone HemW [Alphaproteobacteria bacterium]
MTLGIYVHWPFCVSKCPYCDFNSRVAGEIDQARWRRALLRDLDHFAAETTGRTVGSLFFGGGTPSLMAPETVAAIVDAVRRHWTVSPDLEISLEANPGTVDRGRFLALRAAGITRLSLGVQSLNEEALRFLGRVHGVAEALDAIALAGATFPRLSLDLIHARPGQTVAGWREELERALSFGAGHLSLYQLGIETGTAFHRLQARGDLVLPDEDEATRLFEVTQEVTAAAGLPAYEVSNHARPGEECRHNLAGWRGMDYVGIGPGAHGRLTGGDGGGGETDAVYQHPSPGTWLRLVESRGHGTHERARLHADERAEELLLIGLRLVEGVDRRRFHRLTGRPLTVAPEVLARLDGFIDLDDRVLRATPAGRLALNEVLRVLLALCGFRKPALECEGARRMLTRRCRRPPGEPDGR